MSRIGNSPITLPSGTTLTHEGSHVTVKGAKGELSLSLHPLITLKSQDDHFLVVKKNETKLARSLQGTFQRLISNMVEGVNQGFTKTLELVGTGYRVAKQGNKISLTLGYSHPIEFASPEGIKLDIEGNNKIIVSGLDKHAVGQAAASIRSFRPPEPYKGKGIRYAGEAVRRKAGKAAKAAA